MAPTIELTGPHRVYLRFGVSIALALVVLAVFAAMLVKMSIQPTYWLLQLSNENVVLPWAPSALAFPAFTVCPHVNASLLPASLPADLACFYVPKGTAGFLSTNSMTPAPMRQVPLYLPGLAAEALSFGCLDFNMAGATSTGVGVVSNGPDDAVACTSETGGALLVAVWVAVNGAARSTPSVAQGFAYMTAGEYTGMSLTRTSATNAAGDTIEQSFYASTQPVAPLSATAGATGFTLSFPTGGYYSYAQFAPLSFGQVFSITVATGVLCGLAAALLFALTRDQRSGAPALIGDASAGYGAL